MTLLVIFGIMAAALAAVGIYGVMSYSVTQRTGEIAVRSAMGASTPQLMRLFLGQGAVLAVAGVVLGLLTAVAVRQDSRKPVVRDCRAGCSRVRRRSSCPVGRRGPGLVPAGQTGYEARSRGPRR